MTRALINVPSRARRGEIIAIQGDRVTPGISTLPATLFGRSAVIPARPFALSMAARAPPKIGTSIFPPSAARAMLIGTSTIRSSPSRRKSGCSASSM